MTSLVESPQITGLSDVNEFQLDCSYDSDSSLNSKASFETVSKSKVKGSRVQFNQSIRVSYTHAPEDYDRNPVEPPPMTAKDYYDYQVWAFEMHQSIRFETTMRQLGLWNNPSPIDDESISTLIPTIVALQTHPTLTSSLLLGTYGSDSDSAVSSNSSSGNVSPSDDSGLHNRHESFYSKQSFQEFDSLPESCIPVSYSL